MKPQTATFALGCFWAPDDYFSKLAGVISTTAGYAGGDKIDPTYHDLGDQTECVEIVFDSEVISYQELLDYFFKLHDSSIKQKAQYKSAILTHDETQQELAQSAMQNHPEAVTEIYPLGKFYPAEDYHQKYYQKHGL